MVVGEYCLGEREVHTETELSYYYYVREGTAQDVDRVTWVSEWVLNWHKALCMNKSMVKRVTCDVNKVKLISREREERARLANMGIEFRVPQERSNKLWHFSHFALVYTFLYLHFSDILGPKWTATLHRLLTPPLNKNKSNNHSTQPTY
jgi:hypothetical protein